MLQVGRYELHAIEAGRLRLDGGSMFGVVPRALWSQGAAPDELNRIRLAMRCLLAIDRAAGRVILVDSGPGAKWTGEDIERFAFEIDGDPLGRALRCCGVADDDVTDIIVTHLHFDHNAGLTRRADPSCQAAVPRFPRARHWVHAAHLAHALQPSLKDRGSFLARDFEPCREGGLLEVLEGDEPPSPFADLQWFVAHGHTPFQLLPRFCGQGSAVQFLADLVPTTRHLPLPWVMAFDNQPLRTIEEKKRLYRECGEGDLVLFFEHDPEIAAARIDASGRRPEIRETVAI